MQIMVVLLMIIAIMSMQDNGQQDYVTSEMKQAAAIAGQMAFYHNAALRACPFPASCGDGAVVPDIQIGSTHFGFQGKISAVYDVASGMIVTTWLPEAALNDPGHYFGQISSALHINNPGTIISGPYDLATQTVRGTPIRLSSIDPSQGYVSPPTNVPSTVGGITLLDHEPVIATHIR